MMMTCAFSIKTKAFTELKMFQLKNSQQSVDGWLATICSFILRKIKQSAFYF